MEKSRIHGISKTSRAKVLSLVNSSREADNVASIAAIQIMAVDHVAASFALGSMPQLRSTPDVNRWIRKIPAECNLLKFKFEEMFSPGLRTLLYTAACNVADSISNDTAKMFFAVKQAYDDARLPDSAFYATLETARMLAEYACLQFDRRINDIFTSRLSASEMPTAHILRRNLAPLRATSLHSLLEKASRTATAHLECKINLNASSRCVQAFKVIDIKLTDARRLRDAMDSAAETTHFGVKKEKN